MTEEKDRSLVGKNILSIDSGVGIITGIEMIDTAKYYVVEFGKNNMKSFFPIENNSKIRIISSKNSQWFRFTF